MTISEKDALELRRYCQQIIGSPRMPDQQWWKQEGDYIWCEDWEIIELLKCLFHGQGVYLGDPPPRRLKNNPLWDQKEIIKQAEGLLAKHPGVAGIIDELKERRKIHG